MHTRTATLAIVGLLGIVALPAPVAPVRATPVPAGPVTEVETVSAPGRLTTDRSARETTGRPGGSDREVAGAALTLVSGPEVVAHRGASAYAPENTLAALDRAAELGIGWVENDVQRTRDGELVVVHDRDLERTTDVEEVFPDRAPWLVKDFTAAEIDRLDAGGWFGDAYAGEGVPTLAEFARRAESRGVSLLVEIKHPESYPGIEGQILRVLTAEGWIAPRAHGPTERLIVQSFSAESVRTVHGLAPSVRTGFIGTPAVSALPVYAAFADQVNPRHTDLTPDFVAAAHALAGPHGEPLEVFTWTIDDVDTARRVAEYGVDGIISNRPDLVRDAVRDPSAAR
ncbi:MULTISPECIES: glycerophosphodiester phosphodiesterase [unclassified Streptomyces]|uniref:glycerophosphodiester phosphodiesterase n=1 Tax=unclassified Streptomyces TaxID=2593676 RepID=UPI0019035499|nr:glycerophosphodiester phosphodiesterase family protein [Streptomyces sp. HSG2]